MTLYLYAISDRPDRPLPDQAGLDDAPLAQIVWRDIAAVVSACDGPPRSASPDEVWRHEDVLESLMRDRTVLPVRFGTTAASRARIGDMLSGAYPGLAQDIARVRDHVEIGMRFLMAEPEPADMADVSAAPAHAGGPGAAYLRNRLAQELRLRDRQRARLTMVQDVCRQLGEHASASRLDDERAAAAFLVARDRLAPFRDRVGEAAHAHPELALLCTGPWPPYSFVDAGARVPCGGRHAG